MFDYPDDLRYTDSHEYIRQEGDLVTIGITAFAIDQLGDVVVVDLPAVGSTLEQGKPFATVESVKAVEDVYAPVSGEVVAVNTDLSEAPETLETDPYGACWFVKVRAADPLDLSNTMSAAEYRAKVEGL